MVPPEHPEAADPQEPKPEEPTPDGPRQDADSQPANADSADAEPAEDKESEDKPEPAPAEDKPTEALPAVSPPTRKSNIRLLVAIGLAVLVLAGGGATIVVLASQDRPEDIALQKSRAEARGVVERFAVLFAQARNDGAFSLSKSDVQALLCSREQDALEQEWQERETKEINRSSSPETPPARLGLTVKEIKIEGDIGVATLTGSLADRKTDQDFGLVKEEGQWKVCDVVFRIPKSSSSSNPTTPSDVGTTDGTTPPGTTVPTGTGTDTPTTTTTETQ